MCLACQMDEELWLAYQEYLEKRGIDPNSVEIGPAGPSLAHATEPQPAPKFSCDET